jgi:type IV secretion system protein TrbG
MKHTGCISAALILLAGGAAAATNPSSATPQANRPPGTLQPDVPQTPGLVPARALEGVLPDTKAPPADDVGFGQPPQAAAANCTKPDCQGPRTATPSPESARRKAGTPIQIGEPARRALAQSHAWAENPLAIPSRDSGGRVVFPFSESAPTIVCAPLKVCDIELQPGESVEGAPHIGDGVRWKVAPAVSGSDDQKVVHLIVKPTQPGLDTNLVVPTDRHTYHIRLVSSTRMYVSSVAFSYPDEQQQAWSDLTKKAAPRAAESDMATVAVNRLNFNYRIKVVKGKPTFKPLRAMDDGYHTYIAMNEDLVQAEAPALVGIRSSGEEQMVNYRVKGNLYVIDGTLSRLALISGVGKRQERIELTREPCMKRGWLGVCWDAKE